MEKMDSSTNNRNRVQLWLYRLLNFNQNNNKTPTNHRRFDEIDADDDDESNHHQSTTNCTQTRKSFRKSLKKMQTSMKSCIVQNRTKSTTIPTTRNSTEIPAEITTNSSSSSSSSQQQEDDLPVVPPRSNSDDHPHNHRIPTEEIQSLASCYWYWGPMSTSKAEEMLKFKPDGTFLVRDSSSASYLFSISFRSVGKTMHARIEYNRGKYNLYGSFITDGYNTVTELIQDAIRISENDVYCYSRKSENDCDFPVRFTQPISRYQEVRSLKYLARFIIRQYTNINDICKLPVPRELHNYLLETPYF